MIIIINPILNKEKISFHIIIIITTIVMVVIFYTRNQYDYPNNYQIINYSFNGYLLVEQWDVFF